MDGFVMILDGFVLMVDGAWLGFVVCGDEWPCDALSHSFYG